MHQARFVVNKQVLAAFEARAAVENLSLLVFAGVGLTRRGSGRRSRLRLIRSSRNSSDRYERPSRTTKIFRLASNARQTRLDGLSVRNSTGVDIGTGFRGAGRPRTHKGDAFRIPA